MRWPYHLGMARQLAVGRLTPVAARWPTLARVSRLIGRLDVLPTAKPLGPVQYSAPLVVLVTLVSGAALGLAVLTVRAPSDWLTLGVGAVVVFLMGVYAIRSLPPIETTWSPSIFVILGLTITLGPAGATAASIAEALGSGIRSRIGWFRTVFNFANFVLSNITAWLVFSSLVRLDQATWVEMFAGLAAGLCQSIVNYMLLYGVVRIATSTATLPGFVRVWREVVPYSAGYGLAAFAFAVMHQAAGTIGFFSVVVPVLLLQGFLIVFARRAQAFEEQRAAHQREREALLQRAVDASEAERRRIARDLHDGVVQNLAGMAFTLTATASEIRGQADVNGNAALLEILEQSAEETRVAMKDLRTLIIEIAPPTLRREGLHAALLEVLQTIKAAGTKTRLELPSNMRLRQDRAGLIFRVAQEVLRNVAAHAEAKHVSVILKEVDNSAVLRIVDDGKGFSADDVARRRAEGHVGTNAIVELAEEAGGSLRIESSPGKGTRVTLSVPTE